MIGVVIFTVSAFLVTTALLYSKGRRSYVLQGTGQKTDDGLQISRLIAGLYFLLLLSGPPQFRVRDPMASFRGELDWVILLHIIVWGLAGVWILHTLHRHFLHKSIGARFGVAQLLGFLLVVFLSASVLVSPTPLVSVFRTYQVLVLILFGFFFVNRYGTENFLKLLLVGCAILGVTIVFCAAVAPDLVVRSGPKEGFRLRGDLIASSAEVSVFGLIALFGIARRKFGIAMVLLLGLFAGLLILSRSRTAFAIVFLLMALGALGATHMPAWRRLGFAGIISIPFVFVTGIGPLVSGWITRDADTLLTLYRRADIWVYLVNVTLRESPWIGLGYFSHRFYSSVAIEEVLLSPHSAFFAILAGGGLLSMTVFVAVWCLVFLHAFYAFYRYRGGLSFTILSLLLAALGFSLIGAIRPGMVALVFWSLAAMLPLARTRVTQAESRERAVPNAEGRLQE